MEKKHFSFFLASLRSCDCFGHLLVVSFASGFIFNLKVGGWWWYLMHLIQFHRDYVTDNSTRDVSEENEMIFVHHVLKESQDKDSQAKPTKSSDKMSHFSAVSSPVFHRSGKLKCHKIAENSLLNLRAFLSLISLSNLIYHLSTLATQKRPNDDDDDGGEGGQTGYIWNGGR